MLYSCTVKAAIEIFECALSHERMRKVLAKRPPDTNQDDFDNMINDDRRLTLPVQFADG